MNQPFFSIIIPCCNVEPYVRECLDSILNQSFADWEALIGVETSKDKTEEIVREYEAKDSRFKVFTGPRSGSCSVSRNTGTDMATGDYVIFLDGDDTITEGSLQRLHDKIAERPGADLYPCAILVHNETTGKEEPTRDNYPLDFNGELTGSEAILLIYRNQQNPCPMLQLTIFRREFLVEHNLKCFPGLRRQDSEFSPRALYYAKRVIPLHEKFYVYRIQSTSVSSSAKGAGYFLGDWAIILNSLMAFHAKISKNPDFKRQISDCWARQWLSWLFYFWFDPKNINSVPRARRLETLEKLFKDGFDDFKLVAAAASKSKRIAAWWVRSFVRIPAMRVIAECFFRIFFLCQNLKKH